MLCGTEFQDQWDSRIFEICVWVTAYLITYLLTYSMEQSPSWEANRVSS